MSNPAIDRQLAMPPALLEEIAENPESLAKLHRVQRAVLADRAVRQLLTSDSPSPQHMATLIEALRKAEKDDLPQKSGAAGPGFHFSIHLPSSGQTFAIDTRPAIEGELEDE